MLKLSRRVVLINILIFIVLFVFFTIFLEFYLRLNLRLNYAYLAKYSNELSEEISEKLNLRKKENMIIHKDETGLNFIIDPPLTKLHIPQDKSDIKLGAVENIETDQNGFCNKNVNYNKKIKILGIGDSFTWCLAVEAEQTWPQLLKDDLNNSGYNISQPGLNLVDYVNFLKKFGLKYNPEIVILNFYEGNDVNVSKTLLSGDKLKKNIPIAESYYKNKWSSYSSRMYRHLINSDIFKKSYSLNLYMVFIREFVVNIESIFLKDPRTNPDFKKKYDFKYTITHMGKEIIFNKSNNDLNEIEFAIEVTEGKISLDNFLGPSTEEFVNLSKENNFKPIIIYSPAAYTAYSNNIKFSDENLRNLMKSFSKVQRNWLKKQSDILGFKFIDPVQTFLNRNQTIPLTHFPSNRHYTAEGHKLLAEIIAKEIEAF